MGLNQKYRAMPKPLVDGPTEGEPVQDRGVIIDGVSFFGLAYGHPESLIPEGTDNAQMLIAPDDVKQIEDASNDE